MRELFHDVNWQTQNALQAYKVFLEASPGFHQGLI
jgi:hypothetical protein